MALSNKSQDYSAWYNDIVSQAWLAENSDVRWCMVIKPYWYAIRENMRDVLDSMIKNTGHSNAYFPLFIPKSYFSKEANHVDGFAKECAVVTHYRLKNDENGKGIVVDPDAKLEEELIVRPTSETIIRNTYRDRIQSYRDLPLLINQRANVVRREMRTRAFLRTSEFLRQEWHTAHATSDEAIAEQVKMLDVYNDFSENFLALYSILWSKPEHEKFAWATTTYTFEQMMQDGKALQSGTSHFLGQNFAKAFDVKFQNKENKEEFVRATSWWVSTRLMWWLIMWHSDDKWLVLPPAIAPLHFVIIPVFKNQEDLDKILEYINPIQNILDHEELCFESKYTKIKTKVKYKIDTDPDRSMGRKCNQYELQWVPVRLVIGKKELSDWNVEVYTRRDDTKQIVSLDELLGYLDRKLYKIQNEMISKHKKFTLENTKYVNNYQDFKKQIEWWFALAHWDETTETAEKIKEETKATVRCIPFDYSIFWLSEDEICDGKCIITWKPSRQLVVFAKNY